MHVSSLAITNFRGIQEVVLKDLGRMVIIAGQNGSGKSCIFDAIRVLKSAYGGYQPNEWQQWLGEFQIRLTHNAADPQDFLSMFHDRSKPARIECDFKLSQDERTYILANASSLIRNSIQKESSPGGPRGQSSSPFLAHRNTSDDQINELVALLTQELANDTLKAKLEFVPNELPRIHPSWALSAVFSTYRPAHLGIVDYHGPHRNYGREFVQNVNFDLTDKTNRQGQSALYNYAGKYANVKSEMAASFIHEIIAREAGLNNPSETTLTETLKELFETFFPDKIFLGPTATTAGTLAFNVELSNGNIHDIDELSSGEKEILYGYLRIRNSAPKDSIVLIDEPELHLNPKLIKDLPSFYAKHLADVHNNQIWLITHSDTLLREVVGIDGYDVFHMLPAGNSESSTQQLKTLSVKQDLQAVLVSLVGDLAAYHPGGKVVLFEGGGDSDFDKRFVGTLFPELAKRATLISANSKQRVSALHEVLDRISNDGELPFTFFSITDADSDRKPAKTVRSYRWNVYHIENYLLSSVHIRLAMEELGQRNIPKESDISTLLASCAERAMRELHRHLLVSYADQLIIKRVKIGCAPNEQDLGASIAIVVDGCFQKLKELSENELTTSGIVSKSQQIRADLQNSLTDGTWIKKFPGRSILKNFVDSHVDTSYDAFKMLVISQMRRSSYTPEGMRSVVELILNE